MKSLCNCYIIPFFSLFQRRLPVDTTQVEQAIAQLELVTSAELRVVVERKSKKGANAILRAEQLFDTLEMWDTAERNAVLIYLSFKPHAIAVVGDQAIHAKVGEVFWQNVYDSMKAECQKGDYTRALCVGILQVEEVLAQHFPRAENDVNELPNQVVIK